MTTMPKTIGVFAGLLTSQGKLRLQRRVEKDSIIPGKTYEGDWELPGGRIKEKDIKKALTIEVLGEELRREVMEELGIPIAIPKKPSIYLAKYEDLEKNICDWALMIPILSRDWNENAKTKRTTIDVNPLELRGLAFRLKGNQLVSGWSKRMCRMSEGALFNSYKYKEEAERETLTRLSRIGEKPNIFRMSERRSLNFEES